MRPWLLRPACVGSDSTSVFSGSSVVISSKPEIAMKRRPGLVGLNFLIGMVLLSDAPKQPFDLLAFAERDDGLLPGGRVSDRTDPARVAPGLATHHHGVDVPDSDSLSLVLLFEGLLDLGLGGRPRDPEGVPPLRVQEVGPLGDERADDDFGGGARGHWSSPSWSWLSPCPALGRSGRLKFSSISSRQSFASNR